METNGGILILLVKKIYQSKLNKYRKKIDDQLKLILNSEIKDSAIIEMLDYALRSGRRFRPLLFLLAYKIYHPDLDQNHYSIAVAIELLHKASLIHDDILDEDKFRRGKASFYHQYGLREAIIAGDLLVSMAFEQFFRFVKDPHLGQEWTKLYRLLATGEMQDLLWEDNWEIEITKLNEMIYGKTASFLEFVMKAGAFLATNDLEEAEKLGLFGKEIGFAFQIMNDLNNWDGLEEELGRLEKKDINSGKVNLVTRLANDLQLKNITPEDLELELSKKINTLALDHISTAQNVLNEINVTNRYTQILTKLLTEFDQKWFWVDRDE